MGSNGALDNDGDTYLCPLIENVGPGSCLPESAVE